MGLKMIFYLTNVTNAVILSQPCVCIGGGLHAPSFRTALIFDIYLLVPSIPLQSSKVPVFVRICQKRCAHASRRVSPEAHARGTFVLCCRQNKARALASGLPWGSREEQGAACGGAIHLGLRARKTEGKQ